MSDKPLVHVIDDDDAARDSLAFLLTANGVAAETYESAQTFLETNGSAVAGCIVTDIRMPGMTGLELLHRLKEMLVPAPVILITGHGDIPLAVEAMKAGAADFFEKPYDDQALLKAIRESLASAGSGAASESNRAEIATRIAGLSGREKDVMNGLLAGKSNKAIAADLDISPRTVEIYRANVMSKMNADSLPSLVRMAVRAGFSEA